MSLYGVFERLPFAGVLASSSIIFLLLILYLCFNRIAFSGSFFSKIDLNIYLILNKREFFMLIVLVLFTIILGIYPSIVLDGNINNYYYYIMYII